MFGFGSKTTVVTDRFQLAEALRTSDKVVVEGDADLLNYALGFVDREAAGRADLSFETRVAAAAPLRPAPRLAQTERDTDAVASEEPEPVSPGRFPPRLNSPPPAEPPSASAMPPMGEPASMEWSPADAASARRRGYGLPSLLIGASLTAIALVAVYVSFLRPAAEPPTAVAGPPPQTVGGNTPPITIPPATEGSDVAAIVQSVVWPAVAIVALIVMYLLARQAITADRNVEVSWKITEKVGGRLVITKVKTAAPRKKAA